MRRRIIATQLAGSTIAVLLVVVGHTWPADPLPRVGWLVVLLGALGLTLALAQRLADRIVDPLREIAIAAARLGSGDVRPIRRRYGIAELDAVAEVLDVSADRVADQISAERRLAADVSHQLRTPLTALSLRLEEIAGTDDPVAVRAEARIAQQQVERLSGVVESLLRHASQGHSSQDVVDVDTVLVQQLEEWRGTYVAQERAVEIGGEPGLRVWVSTSVLSQVVATLLENALVHGSGRTSIRTRTAGGTVVVEVADEGTGVADDLARRIFERDVSGAARSGLGLAVARSLIEVEGGRLELVRRRPATFAIFLGQAAEDVVTVRA